MRPVSAGKTFSILHSIRTTFTDGPFLRKVLTVAFPVAIQNLLNTVTNMVDTIMIGSLGAATIAAVGLANKYFFVFGLLVFGICSGSGVLAAQFFGSKNLTNIRRSMGLALIMASAASLLFFVPGFVRPDLVMRIFTSSPDAQAIGTVYLRIVIFSYWFSAVNVAMVHMLRICGLAAAPVLTSCLAIVVNIALNYVLIFGHLGAPRMGVAGAAVATLIARFMEFAALGAVFLSARVPAGYLPSREEGTVRDASGRIYIFRGRIAEYFRWNSSFIRHFLSTSVPVICNEFIWGLGTTLYSVAYGRMGDDSVAAVTIAQTIVDMMTVLWFGLSSATGVILGNELGAGKLREAEDHAAKFCVVSVVLSVAMMLLLWFIRYPITRIFMAGPEVETLVVRILNRFLIVFIPKMLNTIIVVGILRAGGDTRWCLFIDTSGVWLVGVPLAFLGAVVWKLPIYTVYFLVCIEEFYKMFFGLWRVGKKKWLRNIAIEVQ